MVTVTFRDKRWIFPAATSWEVDQFGRLHIQGPDKPCAAFNVNVWDAVAWDAVKPTFSSEQSREAVEAFDRSLAPTIESKGGRK